jgi:hypothetical protein
MSASVSKKPKLLPLLIGSVVALVAPMPALAKQDKDDDRKPPFPLLFDGKFSVGGGLGGARHGGLVKDNDDGSLSAVSTDKSSLPRRIFVAYEPWQNIGFQFGYTDLGKDSFKATSSGGPSWAAGPVHTGHQADGWELTLYDRIPITERYTLILRIGQYFWKSEQTYTDSGGTYPVDKKTGSSLTYGLGFEYDIGIKNYFFWRGELQRYTVWDKDLSANAAWINVGLRF